MSQTRKKKRPHRIHEPHPMFISRAQRQCEHMGSLTVHTFVERTQKTGISEPKPIRCERADGHESNGSDVTAFHRSGAYRAAGRVVWTDIEPRCMVKKTVKRRKL